MKHFPKNLTLLIALGFFIPAIALANCPPLEQVTFKCVAQDAARHCNWMAPWWDGYHGDVEPGEHPVSFRAAFWGASQDPMVGSTNCFYGDSKGNWVELSQNSWGGVPQPTASAWRDGGWPMPANLKEGKICTESLEACTFAYGP